MVYSKHKSMLLNFIVSFNAVVSTNYHQAVVIAGSGCRKNLLYFSIVMYYINILFFVYTEDRQGANKLGIQTVSVFLVDNLCKMITI